MTSCTVLSTNTYSGRNCCLFIAWGREQVLAKSWYMFTILHGVTYPTTVSLSITTPYLTSIPRLYASRKFITSSRWDRNWPMRTSRHQYAIAKYSYTNATSFDLNTPLLLFSRLYNVSTSSCAHLIIILSSSSSCLCHSSLLPLLPFLPISPLIPSAQVSLGLPRFLLPGGLHFLTSFGNLSSSILWTCPYHWSCLV